MSDSPPRRQRPTTIRGTTYKTTTGCGNLYVTINEDDTGPYEIFATLGKAGGCAAAQTQAIARLASIMLQYHIPLGQVRDALVGIRCHQPAFSEGRQNYSCADAIAGAINQHMGICETQHDTTTFPTAEKSSTDSIVGGAGACPECGSALQPSDGCSICRSCGYSKCG